MENFWQKSDKQKHLTALEVRRAVWNVACYARRLPWQGEQRPASSIKSVGSATRTGRHGIKLATFSPAVFDARHRFLNSSRAVGCERSDRLF